MSIPSDQHNQAVGRRLEQTRDALGLSQQVFAGSLGISLRTYQNYERGERAVTKDLICLLIEKHNVDPRWLLTGQESGHAKIELAVFEEVRRALRGELSAIPTEELDAYTVEIYNRVSSIANAEQRQLLIDGFVAIASRERLKAEIRVYDFYLERYDSIPPGKLREIPNATPDEIKKLRDKFVESLAKVEGFIKSLPLAERNQESTRESTSSIISSSATRNVRSDKSAIARKREKRKK